MAYLNGKGPANDINKTGRKLGKCQNPPTVTVMGKLGIGMGWRLQSGGGAGKGKRIQSGKKLK